MGETNGDRNEERDARRGSRDRNGFRKDLA
jgi:hypothetical protein